MGRRAAGGKRQLGRGVAGGHGRAPRSTGWVGLLVNPSSTYPAVGRRPCPKTAPPSGSGRRRGPGGGARLPACVRRRGRAGRAVSGSRHRGSARAAAAARRRSGGKAGPPAAWCAERGRAPKTRGGGRGTRWSGLALGASRRSSGGGALQRPERAGSGRAWMEGQETAGRGRWEPPPLEAPALSSYRRIEGLRSICRANRSQPARGILQAASPAAAVAF